MAARCVIQCRFAASPRRIGPSRPRYLVSGCQRLPAALLAAPCGTGTACQRRLPCQHCRCLDLQGKHDPAGGCAGSRVGGYGGPVDIYRVRIHKAKKDQSLARPRPRLALAPLKIKKRSEVKKDAPVSRLCILYIAFPRRRLYKQHSPSTKGPCARA